MGRIILITGGARSGKSRHAEAMASAHGTAVTYVATAQALDGEMVARIAQHQARRPATWTTLEAPSDLAATLATVADPDAVLVDCLSLWTSNRLLALGDDAAPDWWQLVAALEAALAAELHGAIATARQRHWDLLIVTNEVGFGVVPASRLGRAFRDLLGRLNQAAAAEADAVYLVVAGLAVELKVLAGAPASLYRIRRTRPTREEGKQSVEQLTQLCRRIGPLDSEAMRLTQRRLDQLTKPPGSLGRLEELVITISGITGRSDARLPRKAVIVAAGDHGVAAEGVSAYPQAVTAQMVGNFLAGGAAINVLARRVGARVVVADLGVAADLPDHPALVRRKIGYGTRNMVREPAMRAGEAAASIEAGVAIVEAEVARGLDVVAVGEMGIANTTAASAIVAAVTGAPVAAVTGRGTGISDEQWHHKVAVIAHTLALHRPMANDALDVLTKVGGYEIGGLVGVILAAAAHRLPVIVDGFIAGAAALLACEYCPAVRDYLIAAHTSVEVGHRVLLERLALAPLLDLNLRLGEGTGAVIAMHLLDDAAAVLAEMATFGEAGVSEQEPPSNR